MADVAPNADKELRLLLAFFGDAAVPNCISVPPENVPEPFRRLLNHHDHMTLALEEHFGHSVRVHPYLVRREGDLYGRKLDLSIPSGQIVMTGAMLFNLRSVSAEVAARIVEQKTPLGRILIEHDVLRRITGVSLLRFPAEEPLLGRFGRPATGPAYGRVATILCDEKPAVDLLEIVTPFA